MTLSATMLRQLRALKAQESHVNLGTVRSLIRRGLATQRYGNELSTRCRMPGAYPLTDAGHAILKEQDQLDAHWPSDRV